jgi:tetratricopeptide (TPR) repeat protein
VFVGGFDLPAAEAVCGADPIDATDVLDLLGSLVDKSLVMLDERGDGNRYRMLETIREYAREKLDQRGEDAAATAARHCQHFFAFVKAGREGLKGADQGLWIGRLETEIDNLRAATTLALSGGVDPFIAVKIAVALLRFWLLRGYVNEGRRVVRAALALPAVQASDLARAWTLYVGAVLARVQGEHAEARRMLESCLVLRRLLGDPVEIAGTLSTLALTRLNAGDPAAAKRAEEEALQMFRQLGNRLGEMWGLIHLGQIALYEGDGERAGHHVGIALDVARELGHREGEAESELLLGEIAFSTGRLEDAAARFWKSLGVCRNAGDRNGEANAQRWLGKVDLERGHLESARGQLGAALRAFEAFEMREELVDCLEDHALLLLQEGRPRDAARLAGAAVQARVRLALVRPPRAEQLWAALLDRLRESCADPQFDAVWQQGERQETKEAVRVALEPPSGSLVEIDSDSVAAMR